MLYWDHYNKIFHVRVTDGMAEERLVEFLTISYPTWYPYDFFVSDEFIRPDDMDREKV